MNMNLFANLSEVQEKKSHLFDNVTLVFGDLCASMNIDFYTGQDFSE